MFSNSTSISRRISGSALRTPVAGIGHVSQEVPAVRDSAAFGVAALFELGLCELLHQRMQQTARAFLAQQRLVRQRRQHGQCNATDGARRLRGESTAEHGQPRQRLALAFPEQGPGVLEHGFDAGVTCRPRSFRGVQQIGITLELGGDILARQHTRPGRRQFKRERQSLDASTDVDDGGSLGHRIQIRLDAARRGDEKAYRVEGLELADVFRFRHWQARQRQQPFRCQPKTHTRGDDRLHARTRREETVEQRRAFDELLEVVEHQQRRARAQHFDDLFERICIAPLRDAELAPESLTEFGRGRQVVERHQGGAVGKHRRALAEHALCQSRLADTAGSRDREQPAIVLSEQRCGAPQFHGAANEAVVGGRRHKRHGSNGGRGGAEAVVQYLEFGARFESEFVGEARDKLAIDLSCARNLPGSRKPCHVGLQCCFIKRIGVEQTCCEVDRLDGVDVTGQSLLRRAAPRGLQPIPLEAQPAGPGFVAVVVKSGEQCALVERERVFRPMFAQSIVECLHVGGGFEPKCAALPLDLIRPRESLQAKQRLAQVGVRELAVLIRPQQRGEFPAPDPGALHREINEQLGATFETEGDRLAAVDECRRTEQCQGNGHCSGLMSTRACP